MNPQAKKMLKEGNLLLIQVLEQGSVPIMIQLLIVPPADVSRIEPPVRTVLLSAIRSWIFLSGVETAPEISTPSFNFNLVPNSDGSAKDLKYLIPYAQKSWEFFKNLWPYEAAVVEEAVYDVNTASQILAPMPNPWGLMMQSNMLSGPLQEISVGEIIRASSPASYFPRLVENQDGRLDMPVGEYYPSHEDDNSEEENDEPGT